VSIHWCGIFLVPLAGFVSGAVNKADILCTKSRTVLAEFRATEKCTSFLVPQDPIREFVEHLQAVYYIKTAA
jgi:hypothetical protein